MKRSSEPQLAHVLTVAPVTIAEVVALQALSQGIADAEQQKRALDWILFKACDFHGISFRESERDTSFAEGKRFVAQQINAQLITNARLMKETY